MQGSRSLRSILWGIMTTNPPTARISVFSLILNVVRGALIGAAELIPGISGGTVALITGVYERLLDAISHLFEAVKRLVLGPDRLAGFRDEVRRTDWWLVGPVLLGMAAMVLTMAGVVESLVSADPVAARGLFFGLVAASLIVPIRMVQQEARDNSQPTSAARWTAGIIVLIVAAVIAFLLIGFADSGVVAEPPLWTVFLAAAVAICALVVPGVSGSFFLLAVGLYSTTLQAVSSRDLPYIAVFAAGALLGLVTIVRGMKWLLTRYRQFTLLAVVGLLLGSLRALWPWQRSESGNTDGVGVLLLPQGDMLLPIALAALGAVIVVVMIVIEDRLSARIVTNSEASDITAV